MTAVAAYDGHDASVLALNRALLAGARPVEVVYLGFNMTGEKIATAALQEGADAVAVSSYNGGHLQFFPHLLRRLAEMGMERTLLFGGGGGYYGYRRWGSGGGVGIVGVVLIVLVCLYLFGGLRLPN